MTRLSLFLVLVYGLSPALAADWPTYGGNASRTFYTAEELPTKLSLRWVRKERHAPMPAWPVSTRMPFDRAMYPVSDGERVYFGSTVTGKVHALDGTSGAERWSFFTNGPVRFAPVLWKDRVLVASDDGYLYCLNSTDGKLVWSKRGGPDGRLLLGNDRMISRWPARGGPLVVEDVVYFGAGIWPSEGIYLYALDAGTGKVRWVNDDSGSIYMAQPHGGANAESGVSSQGYLVAAGDKLLVPTGRAVPAVFDRTTGKFLYFQLQQNGHKGGTSTLATGPRFINAGASYELATGTLLDVLGPGEVAAPADGILRTTVKEAIAYHWADKTKTDRKGNKINYRGLDKTFALADVPGGTSIVVAGKSLICGGEKSITRADLKAKKAVWSADVDGTPLALAVASGRLYVGTDRGTLYCFDGKGDAKPTMLLNPLDASAYPDKEVAAKAEEIVKTCGVREGWCVDLGCGDGALAYELAKRTNLNIVAIDADADKVAIARKKLDAAGVYGKRVTVFHGDPSATNFPRYFADLVVSSSHSVKSKEATRLQRPFGGVDYLDGKKNVCGPLEGAGSWTHQYADAANTCCSNDALVKDKLGMLWFRDSDFDMPSRHGRAPAPLFHEGRLIVEGMNGLRAVDAYNGRTLWEYSLPEVLKPYHGEHLVGTAATQSNLCLTSDGVYVRAGNRCLRLDPATGKKLGEFTAPKLLGKTAPWGYIAVEGGVLFGSLSDTRHVVKYAYGKSNMDQLFSESQAFFAFDAKTGKEKWSYKAKHAIRHNAIAVGGGRVYLIDRPLAEKDKTNGDKDKEHPNGELLAFDAETGKILWRKTEDIYGTLLALGAKHDVLLMSYQPTRFKLPSEVGGSLTAFRASDGKSLWDRKANYLTRPVLNDRTVYAQGGAWDLVSGDTKPFNFKRSYGCGQLAGCANLMVYRSATLGYFDLKEQKGNVDYGGIRPGCWINAIPAGGLVLVPDATSGCQCSYLNQAWIALQPMEK